ncbi:hypothetical protein [Bacillus atrophaeus]|uniref:hypothetical protein n=1 Tax=Bacillus atrophaeus TaxID=1452 RepID=UPI00227E40C2|nr:hypothetical protein [Bacillus atrophaeus]MCY8519363.1 hypothetical protein [Bacillus atrophaeus]
MRFPGGLVLINYQGKAEQYARTLEEAMLSKFYNLDVLEKKDRSFWIEKRNNDRLKYTIPSPVKPKRDDLDKDEKYSIRDIVRHSENNKTDFMYSVILNGLIEKMLPIYIKEGLDWLQK